MNKTTVTTTTRERRDGKPMEIRRMPNFAVFRDDPDACKVTAIELYDGAD